MTRRVAATVMESAWLAALVLVPLYVNPWLDNPFDGAKLFLFLGLMWVIGLSALGLELLGGMESLRVFVCRPLPALVLLSLVAQGVSTYFSVAPYTSFWGGPRGQGWLTHATYAGLFLVIARHATAARRKRIYLAVVTAGILVSSWAIYASFLPRDGRVAGTLGNANFLAAYLLISIFLVGAYTLRDWRALPVLAFLVVPFLLPWGRGAMVGLVFGVMTVLIVKLPRPFKGPVIALCVLGCLVAAAQLVVAPTFQLRGMMWERTAALMRDSSPMRVAVGYGPETLEKVTGEAQKSISLLGSTDVMDRAHNVPLQVLASTGLLGLGVYLSLWGTVLYKVRHTWMLALVVALFVESLGGIRILSSQIAIFALFGVIALSAQSKVPQRTSPVWASCAALLVVAGLVLGATSQRTAIAASRRAHTGDQLLAASLYAPGVVFLQESLRLDPRHAPRWARLGHGFLAWSEQSGLQLHRIAAQTCFENAVALDPYIPRATWKQ